MDYGLNGYMADSEGMFRLNVIIGLLLLVLTILLWPIIPTLLFYGVVVMFLALLAEMIWDYHDSVDRSAIERNG